MEVLAKSLSKFIQSLDALQRDVLLEDNLEVPSLILQWLKLKLYLTKFLMLCFLLIRIEYMLGKHPTQPTHLNLLTKSLMLYFNMVNKLR